MDIGSRTEAAFDRIYDLGERVLIVPVLMLLVAGAVLGASWMADGQVVAKGIDFTGGTSVQVRVPAEVGPADVQPAFPAAEVRELTGTESGAKFLLVQTPETYSDDQVRALVEENDIPYVGEYREAVSVQSLGAAVGSAFFRDAQMWSAVAILIMSAVIFVAFRDLVPSFAVIFAALTDIVVALAGMHLFGIELTLGSLAALLMLLGYSVDTDILLSTRVLKQREGDMRERMWSSVVTGSTMTFAAIAAFTVLYVVSTATTLDQIASVILIGLVADLPVTWLGNAFILKWHVER